jgi:hypothetical protein
MATASHDVVCLGASLAKDTAAPTIGVPRVERRDGGVSVVVRVHDRKSPCMPHDWRAVAVHYVVGGGEPVVVPLQWYGEYLWRATLPVAAAGELWIEAVDAAGNTARGARVAFPAR